MSWPRCLQMPSPLAFGTGAVTVHATTLEAHVTLVLEAAPPKASAVRAAHAPPAP